MNKWGEYPIDPNATNAAAGRWVALTAGLSQSRLSLRESSVNRANFRGAIGDKLPPFPLDTLD
jgi:hypothetical protein